jgi:hypothetical protein
MIRYPITQAIRRPLILAALLALLLLLLLVLSGPARANVPAQTTVGGEISVDTTWTRANSPYIVTTPVTVTRQATLTIEPGVVVQFEPDTWLLINGGLNAQGTQAQQVRMTAATELPWLGVIVLRPSADVILKSTAVTSAEVGLAIRQQAAFQQAAAARVDVLDSLFAGNRIGIDADYSVSAGAPRLSLRNNLLMGNQIGLQFNTLPGGNLKPKLNHNSFVGNGIGVRTLNISGKGLKAQQHWWGSADGPVIGNSATCSNPPVPGTSAREIVCGAVDFTPWSKVPAGRAFIGPQGGMIESAAGVVALSDDDTQPTSVVTLTVPAGAFSQTVDLLVSGRASAEMPPVQPGLQPTQLFLEITAAADEQEIHQFANGQSLQLEIAYRPEDLDGADPAKLALYYWDEARQVWSFAGYTTTADPANQRVVVRLGHLTRAGLMKVDMRSIALPLVIR